MEIKELFLKTEPVKVMEHTPKLYIPQKVLLNLMLVLPIQLDPMQATRFLLMVLQQEIYRSN